VKAARTGVGRRERTFSCRGWTPWPAYVERRWIRSSSARSDNAFGAYQNLLHGDYQAALWDSRRRCPIGSPRSCRQCENAQCCCRGRQAQEEELEVSHQSLTPCRHGSEPDDCPTRLHRCLAAQREVEAVRAAHERARSSSTCSWKPSELGRRPERLLSDAGQLLTVAIAQVHYRKARCWVQWRHLGRGPWPGKAYFDARAAPRHATPRPLTFNLRLHPAWAAIRPRADQPAGRLSPMEACSTVQSQAIPAIRQGSQAGGLQRPRRARRKPP